MPASVRVRVPAKVNLHLGVGALRPDGFHDLLTVFHALDLTDEVVATAGAGTRLTVTGREATGLPTDRENLAWRAAELLAATTGVWPDVHLELRKSIPVAGGLAGGSADAAATLLACAQLWGVEADLPALAAHLGSDVAFSLLGGTAVGTGRGELLTPVKTTGRLQWVLAVAAYGISTAAAYAELDRFREVRTAPEPIGPPDRLLAALATGDAPAVGAALANDLQAAAFALRPELRRTLELGLESGALGGVVSGSGPTCAFLCADADAAAHIAAMLRAEGVCRAARVATGPAPGAEVID